MSRVPAQPHALALGLAVVGLGACLLAGPASAQGTRQLPSPEARLLLLDGHDRPSLTEPEPPAPTGLQEQYDVLHYDLEIFLDVTRGLIEGTCTITLRSLVPDLEQVELDLHYPEFPVRWAERLDRPGPDLRVVRDVDKLRIFFNGDLPGPGDEVVLAVNYIGRPRAVPGRSPAVTFESSPNGSSRVHSFVEPYLARGWWPCKDRPDDKATLDLEIEAPQSLQVVANGVLRETRRGRDGHFIWSWTHDHPIATYLVGFSAARFQKISQSWPWWEDDGTERRMTVSYWAWPEVAEWAFQDFTPTLDMLDAFGERFGTYPFRDEKYGIMVFGEDGGMEHQTATSIGGSVIALSRGSGAIENVLAHELAHQWWGDDVGIDDFRSVWVKEGLATWSEALWWEENGGLPAYLEYMQDIARPLGGSEFEGTVLDPDATFGQTVYFKGAWVMHMLRWIYAGASLDGDPEPLFEMLRAWRSARSGGVASSEQFTDFLSRERPIDGAVPTAPLSEWFFPQWLQREGRPVYAVDAASRPGEGDSGWTTEVRVEQRQAGEPYAMPVNVRLLLDGGGTADLILFVDGQVHDSSWWTEQRVVGVELDPDGWILKAAVQEAEIDRDDDGWADWLDGCPDVPDPEQLDLNENGLPDACEPGLDFDSDGWLNEDDCAPADAEAWRLPRTDTLLRVEARPGGQVLLRFDHPSPEGQRPYRADVAAGSLVSLRSDGSMANAICLVADLEDEELRTPLHFGGLGTYWVARPENGCPPAADPPTRRSPCP